jgi:predicted HTH domain antitoxin
MSAVMTVELPADVMESARISAEEVRLEIAVALFRVERLSLGRAAELAGLSVQTFLEILCSRRIGVHYGVEDALEDARTLAAHSAA